MGCRVLLALLVLHRAKLLTSNQSILALGRSPPYRSSAICATASCSGFVWLTASILAWTRGGSPSNIAPSHGEGVWGFGKDAEIERPKALQDAKPTKRSYRDREQALFCKNRLFLQSVYISIITENLTQFNPFVYIAQITILKVGNNSLSFFDKKLSNHLIMREKFCIIEK